MISHREILATQRPGHDRGGYNRACAVIGCLLMLVAAGCGGEPLPKRYPVVGRVLVDGKPAADATVVFHPLVPVDVALPQPIGFTDAQGNFALTTIDSRDGAPPGDYAITVQWLAQRNTGEEVVRDGRSLLPPRYGSPEKSDLKFTVVDADNTVPTLELKSR